MGDLVDQCEAWGLVTRAPDPRMRRARRVRFTADRPGLAAGLPEAVAQAEAEFRADVGPEVATVVTIGLEAYAGPAPEPRRQPRISAAGAGRTVQPRQQETGMRILIAEDDQVLADGLLRTLARLRRGGGPRGQRHARPTRP